MHYCPLACLISFLSVVSALGSDPTWFLNEDPSLDTDLSLSPEFLSSALPLDLDFGTGLTTPSADPYSIDISSNDDLLWDTDFDSSNLLNYDGPLLVADACSSSESFPIIAKSRLRRAEVPNSCSNNGINSGASNGNSGTSNEINLPIKLFSPDGFDELNNLIGQTDQAENSQCFLYTQGLLPAGVCSSGQLQDQAAIDGISIRGIQFISLTLRHVTPCTSLLHYLPFLIYATISTCFSLHFDCSMEAMSWEIEILRKLIYSYKLIILDMPARYYNWLDAELIHYRAAPLTTICSVLGLNSMFYCCQRLFESSTYGIEGRTCVSFQQLFNRIMLPQ